MNWRFIAAGILGSSTLMVLPFTYEPKEYTPVENTYYVSNNKESVSYKPQFAEEELKSDVNFKVVETPTEFSIPSQFTVDSDELTSNTPVNLPFISTLTPISEDGNLYSFDSSVRLYAPFDGEIVQVDPAIEKGKVPNLVDIYNNGDGVNLTVQSTGKIKIGEANKYIRMKISHLEKTYASETHTPDNAYAAVGNSDIKYYYTNFKDGVPVPVKTGELLGVTGLTGNISNKDVSKTYVKIELFSSEDKENWDKI